MDALLAIHKAGVQHCHFDEQSVVLRKDNVPIIVGFGGAEEVEGLEAGEDEHPDLGEAWDCSYGYGGQTSVEKE